MCTHTHSVDLPPDEAIVFSSQSSDCNCLTRPWHLKEAKFYFDFRAFESGQWFFTDLGILDFLNPAIISVTVPLQHFHQIADTVRAVGRKILSRRAVGRNSFIHYFKA
mmetsp:Transcript_16963/g.24833  ORF Transcript_16963/g.24833 Transcript_16963/m.24833 type:complete len:108 (-) Transcript_16963:1-324(-)